MADFADRRTELPAVADLRQEIRSSTEVIKRHATVHFKNIQLKLDRVLEEMHLLRQSIVDLRADIAHESRETRTLINLSHEQLDRRFENLEQRLGPAS